MRPCLAPFLLEEAPPCQCWMPERPRTRNVSVSSSLTLRVGAFHERVRLAPARACNPSLRPSYRRVVRTHDKMWFFTVTLLNTVNTAARTTFSSLNPSGLHGVLTSFQRCSCCGLPCSSGLIALQLRVCSRTNPRSEQPQDRPCSSKKPPLPLQILWHPISRHRWLWESAPPAGNSFRRGVALIPLESPVAVLCTLELHRSRVSRAAECIV